MNLVLSLQTVIFAFGMPCKLVLLLVKARHGIWGGRNPGKQPVTGVVVRCGGGGVFHRPIIRSPSSSESVSLGRDLHESFSVVSPVGGARWLERAGVGCSPSPGGRSSA